MGRRRRRWWWWRVLVFRHQTREKSLYFFSTRCKIRETSSQDHPSLFFRLLLISRLREKRWDFFQHEKEFIARKFPKRRFLFYKDTLDDTRNLHGFYFHIYTHTHHARCYRTRARPGCWVMREVRFRLSASKNFMKEKKMCLWLTSFWTPSSLASLPKKCFFFFPLFLSLLLSLVVGCRSRRWWSSSLEQRERSSHWVVTRPIIESMIDFVRVRSSKRREYKRELKVVSRVVSSSKKRNLFSFSPENVRFFRRVERSRERKRCLFLWDKTKKRGP